MLAVRPNYHSPSLTAKAVSTLDSIAPGRLSLNVVSSWWKDEATQYGVPFDVHDARYARTDEWLEVFNRLMVEDTVTHTGPMYDLQGCVMEPKPSRVPTVYMGGESPTAKDTISRRGTAYVMHGDAPDVIAAKVQDMEARRTAAGREKPFQYGVSGYVIVRDTHEEAQAELARILDVGSSPEAYASYQDFLAGSQLESQVSIEEYSVSNRGLRAGLVGTPESVIARLREYDAAGVDLVLLQFSPQLQEMQRFGEQVIRAYT